MNNVIELRSVTKRFGQHTAVDGVSLAVPAGCVFALLGENGAGKSTLIRMLLGLTQPDEGEIRVLGLSSRKDGETIRRQVGYVAERPTLYDWMTAAEIGWFTAGFYGEGFEQNYRQLLTGFGVPADRKIAHMSKGMRAKVVLSLGLAHRPKLLVLDEPTSGLDTLVRREFLESMVDQAATGRTVLLSSHQIGEVERVADWVAIMHEGKLLELAKLEDLKATTRSWTVTMEGNASAPPTMPGTLISRTRHGRQWQLLVRHPKPDIDETMAQLMAASGVVSADSHTPSLEEIFVARIGPDAAPTVSTADPFRLPNRDDELLLGHEQW
ncbi:ABC transporter ATP-binding protein [Aeoliella sp. SH292]|uniref:ABC transporter ATP-binding protein n=1 Tax=Aeoliella sp. SH292 TaxID=3454464 RepID=UPI003F983E99